jgi:hypothetical protein
MRIGFLLFDGGLRGFGERHGLRGVDDTGSGADPSEYHLINI